MTRMNGMNISNLQAFIAVAETGSIHRAAARLHLTQPAVTRRVQNLEATVGALLLNRSSKPPTLTIEGRQVLVLGRRVLQSVSDLLTNAKPGTELSGELHLGVSPGVAEGALGQPLNALIGRFPGLILRVTSGWSAGLVEAMRSEELDAAVLQVTEPQNLDSELQVRPLGTDRAVVIASTDLKIPRRAALAALAEFPWVLNPYGCAARTSLQKAFDRARLPLAVCAEVQGYELQMSLVARGLGLGMLPIGHLRASRYRRKLVEIRVEGFNVVYTTALAWPSSANRYLPALTALEEGFREKRRNASIA